jgi:glutamate carboxypeptidase
LRREEQFSSVFDFMDPLLKALQHRQSEMLGMLRQLVEAESPSTNKTAVDHCGAIIAQIAQQMGARVRLHPSRRTGNHLRAEFPSHRKPVARQILLLGHMDTVWEMGTLRRMPFRVRQGRAYGPGVYDMKGGIVVALFAIRGLQELGVPLKTNIVLLVNADEEIGSLSSRRITEREGRRSDCVLVVEGAHGPRGALKTARKGVGQFEVRVEGRAAHAGVEPEKGASAISEITKQLLFIESITDMGRGITLNTGIVHGGTRINVIPAEAIAKVDARVVRASDAARIEKRLRGLRPFDRRTRVQVTGGFNRPPMERTAQTAALFERTRRLARPLGISLAETAVGGGSDGNFTAALGVPTLDGLGAVGGGAHAAHEHILIRELPRRAALLAHLIASLVSE